MAKIFKIIYLNNKNKIQILIAKGCRDTSFIFYFYYIYIIYLVLFLIHLQHYNLIPNKFFQLLLNVQVSFLVGFALFLKVFYIMQQSHLLTFLYLLIIFIIYYMISKHYLLLFIPLYSINHFIYSVNYVIEL